MIITQLVGKFLNLLYGPLSFMYGIVSWMVSFGQWRNWIDAVIPYLAGPTLLEIGYGPGYLLNRLQNGSYRLLGLDASRQMSRAALRRLRSASPADKNRHTNGIVIRGSALHIPLPTQSIDTIVSTFPTPYIFDPPTLSEIRRVLKPTGRLLILLSVQPHGKTIPSAILSLLYRVTGESPRDPIIIESLVRKKFLDDGFEPGIEWLEVPHARLLLIKI